MRPCLPADRLLSNTVNLVALSDWIIRKVFIFFVLVGGFEEKDNDFPKCVQ